MLQWHRTLIKSIGWMAFDVENPGLVHKHKLKREYKTEIAT
jgi:hypothetical protein